MTLVQTEPATVYVKTGKKKPGRPKNTERRARTNTKINEYFGPASDG
jgi:hypothetical protein